MHVSVLYDGKYSAGVCELLDVPQYGSIGYSMPADENNDYLAGTVATFQCEEGFELFGNMTRTCQNNMTWSKSSPSCLGKIHFYLFLEIHYCMSLFFSPNSQLLALDCLT